MPYILDLRVEVGVVPRIFTFPTLMTLRMTPSLFHFFLFSSFIPPWECPLEAFFSPSSSQFPILLGRTVHLRGRGMTVWGNRLVLYLELEKELTVLTYDSDLCCVGLT